MMAELPQRIESKIDRDDGSGCWLWTAGTNPKGYGLVSRGGRAGGMQAAYRVVYEILVGPIPAGLELDHLCRVHACVNPNHLEPVTRRENQRRGRGFIADKIAQTHCIHGHEFTPQNTYVKPNGTRNCRTCRQDAGRRRRDRRCT